MDAGRYILRRMATDVASAAMDARGVFCRGGCGRSFSGHYHARCRREFPRRCMVGGGAQVGSDYPDSAFCDTHVADEPQRSREIAPGDGVRPGHVGRKRNRRSGVCGCRGDCGAQWLVLTDFCPDSFMAMVRPCRAISCQSCGRRPCRSVARTIGCRPDG